MSGLRHLEIRACSDILARATAMGFFSRKRREPELHVGDPRFDDWATVEEYEDLATATAFAGRLSELGIPNALTADWPLDRFGRGDVYLQVPTDSYDEASAALGAWDD